MIAIDASETRKDSKMPDVPGATTSTTLEHDTGADVIVSPLGMPYTLTLLPRHLEAGAVLIQIKRGEDMVSSILTGAINSALARMREAGAKFGQRVIMSTGYFGPDLADMSSRKVLLGEPAESKRGETYINLRQARQGSPNYDSLATTIRHIMLKGGCYWPLTCNAEIPRELARLEDDLNNMSKTRELWPSATKMYDPPAEDEPFQELVEVKDWRGKLVNMFKNVGPTKANALRDYMLAEEQKAEDTLIQALMVIQSIGDGIIKVPQWSKASARKVSDDIGLPDWAIIVREEFKK